jgi:glycosyltransferase involved in cell wall biosynthesis
MGLKRFARKQIEGWICKLPTKVVCTGQQDAIIGIRELSISAPTVITNGIPLDVFTAVPPLSIIRGQMTFGFVGRLTYQKYPELVAEAFKQISGQYPNAKLVIVGGGELEPIITKILSAEIERGQVEMRPFTKDVAGQLATLDALILPSRWEGLSLSLIEGMVAGRYCITSNIPNNAELVTDGQTGALVSINSPAPLAEAMRAALDNPERTMQLASAARQFGITHHNFDTVADLNEQLYLRLLNNKT